MANKQMMTTTETTVAVYKPGNNATFKQMLQGEIGLSPLAVGTKFESDDLVHADRVHLLDYDWVDYYENEGTPDEKHVNFALWAVEISNEDGKGDYITETGYYQGGLVMSKIAKAIERNNAYDDLRKFGIDVKCEWGKTNAKNPILLVTIV